MNFKKLVLFVEGDHDKLIIENLIKSRLDDFYDQILPTQRWAQLKKKKIYDLIKGYQRSKCDIIFFADLDLTKCITQKKVALNAKYDINLNNIVIVVKMIEGWFLAGINNNLLDKYHIGSYNETESIEKSKFDSLIPSKMSKGEFLLEILKNYDFESARQKNASFNYFYEKYLTGN